MAEYQKYLRKHPDIKPCVVSIGREAYIEDMVKDYGLPIRKSVRLMEKKEIKQKKITKNRQSNVALGIPKSILIGGNR